MRRAIFLLVLAVAGGYLPGVAQTCPGCPITSISVSLGPPSHGQYRCVGEDDYIPVNVTVNHLTCASVDSQFTVDFDSTVFGPFNYDTGTVTIATFKVYKGTNSGTLTVVDDFQCSLSQMVALPGGTFTGVPDTTRPTISGVPQNINVSIASNTTTCSQTVTWTPPTAMDTCDGIVTMTSSHQPGSSFPAGTTPVTYTFTDPSNNSSSCTFYVTVQIPPTTTAVNGTITVTTPTGAYTGGVPTNLYLGYGPQSATITASIAGTGYTYRWTPGANLSDSTIHNPVFTPVAGGTFPFSVIVYNANGCPVDTMSVTFCVKDIRVPNEPTRVYMCHFPANTSTPVTIEVNISSVPGHMNHPGDMLGGCNQGCDGELVQARPGNQIVDDELEMTVLSNPTRTEFQLHIESVASDVADVAVFDPAGRIVEHVRNARTNTDVFVGSSLSPGLYFLRVRQGALTKMTRVLKL